MRNAIMILIAALALLASEVRAQSSCGRVETITGLEGGSFRTSIVEPAEAPAAILILLPGGGGFVDLDDKGCARALRGNALIRSIPAFQAGGMITALMDAPAQYQTREGLAGFRTDPHHAKALGGLTLNLRQKYAVPIWVVGTSRGAISAANAASRLNGPEAPDGVVLTSPVTVGTKGNMAWVIQSVFDLPLKQIRQPLLLIGHVADHCLRSPPADLARLAAATASTRQQIVMVSGGPGSRFTGITLDACEGREPHGFADQETEVAAGIVRFVRGQAY